MKRMQAIRGNQIPTVLVGIVAVLGLVAGAVAATSMGRLQQENDALKNQVAQLSADLNALKSAKTSGTPGSTTDGDAAGNPDAVAAATRAASELAERLGKAEQNLQAMQEKLDAVSNRPAAGSDVPPWMSPDREARFEQLQNDVQMLKERVGELDDSVFRTEQMVKDGKKDGGMFGDDNKPSLSKIKGDLDLTDAQEAALHDSLLVEKQAMFEAMMVADTNGQPVIDNFLRVMLNPKMDQMQKQQAFIDVFTRPLPGRPESLADLSAATNQRLAEQMNQIMTPEQYKKFLSYDCPPADIKIADDPAGAYAMTRIQEIMKEFREEND